MKVNGINNTSPKLVEADFQPLPSTFKKFKSRILVNWIYSSSRTKSRPTNNTPSYSCVVGLRKNYHWYFIWGQHCHFFNGVVLSSLQTVLCRPDWPCVCFNATILGHRLVRCQFSGTFSRLGCSSSHGIINPDDTTEPSFRRHSRSIWHPKDITLDCWLNSYHFVGALACSYY